MDDCLFKPISLMSLSERLNSVHPLPAFTTTHTAPQTLGVTQSESFNMGSVNALTGERPEMIRRLLEQLLRSSEEDRLELNTLEAQGDRAQIRQMAHKIKGAARIVRAARVIETCEAMEAACTETAPLDTVDAYKHAVSVAMIDLERALRDELAKAAS